MVSTTYFWLCPHTGPVFTDAALWLSVQRFQTWHDHVPSCGGLEKAQPLCALLNQSQDYLPLSVFAGIKWDAVKVVHKTVSIRHMFIAGFSLAMLLSLQDISSPTRDWTRALGSEILGVRTAGLPGDSLDTCLLSNYFYYNLLQYWYDIS